MLHHDAVMCLSTETDPAKFRALVVIDQIHRLEATVNHGGLWLETIGLIEEVLAPLHHELHCPAEAPRELPCATAEYRDRPAVYRRLPAAWPPPLVSRSREQTVETSYHS